MSTVTFYCDETEDPIHIWLETYDQHFEVEPGNEMSFEGNYPSRVFRWMVKVGDKSGHITLRAEHMDGKINVYDNDVLIEQW